MKKASKDASRLTVLAAGGDDRAFLEVALSMITGRDRLAREAAVEALAKRPHPGARDPLRALYMELHAGAPKSDRGGDQRAGILRYLIHEPHASDAEVAVLASGTFESDSAGQDSTYNLRLLGLQLLGHVLPPDLLRYYAVEHLDDVSIHDGEPAATAIRLLGETGNHATLYYWLLGASRDSPNLLRGFEALANAPPEIVRRYVEREIASAVAGADEAACTVFAEAIIKLELEQTYPAIAMIMSARISDELYSYLALLLARTNRRALLEILEGRLRSGHRTKPIVEALRVRTTPQQSAILERWERGEEGESG